MVEIGIMYEGISSPWGNCLALAPSCCCLIIEFWRLSVLSSSFFDLSVSDSVS